MIILKVRHGRLKAVSKINMLPQHGGAYRNMFKLAYEGLGSDCYLNERNLLKGSDITLGLVASQRVWGDTDQITREMVTRCG